MHAAVDAGARRIGVVLAEGGLAQIEVVDDGCGMDPAAMALALERHATSKLPDSLIGPDGAIELVTTLGFRGEALPSIASVAGSRRRRVPASLRNGRRMASNPSPYSCPRRQRSSLSTLPSRA